MPSTRGRRGTRRPWTPARERRPPRRTASRDLADTAAVNPFDAIALLVLVLAVLAGVRTGALPQIGGIGGAGIGLLGVLELPPRVGSVTSDPPPPVRPIVVIGALPRAGAVRATIGCR